MMNGEHHTKHLHPVPQPAPRKGFDFSCSF
jgi:hypothetical protein